MVQEADLIESTVQLIPKELLFQHNLESAFKRKGVVRVQRGIRTAVCVQ